MLSPAERILRGQVPYRDFFSEIAPGTFYLQALWFKMFGTHVWSARIPMLLVMAGIGAQIFHLSRLIITGWAAILPVLIYTVAALTRWMVVSHHWYSLFFALGEVIFLIEFLKRKEPAWMVAAGVAAAAAGLCMQNKGALLVLGTVIVVGWICFQKKNGGRKVLLSGLACYLFTVAVLVSLPFCYFYRAGALDDLIYSNFTYLHQSYLSSEFHSLPYLSAHLWRSARHLAGDFSSERLGKLLAEIWWAWLIPAAGIVGAARCWRARDTDDREQRRSLLVILYTGIGLCLMVSEMHRFDLAHMFFGTPLLLVAAVALFSDLAFRGILLSRIMRAILPCIAVYYLASGVSLGIREHRRDVPVHTRRGLLYQTPERAAYYQSMIDEIQSRVGEGGAVLLYPYSPFLYFVTATSNPTRYDYLIPGETTPGQFAEVVTYLRNAPPAAVVISFWKERARTMRHLFPGVPDKIWHDHPVERYLRGAESSYRAMAEMPGFVVYQGDLPHGRQAQRNEEGQPAGK